MQKAQTLTSSLISRLWVIFPAEPVEYTIVQFLHLCWGLHNSDATMALPPTPPTVLSARPAFTYSTFSKIAHRPQEQLDRASPHNQMFLNMGLSEGRVAQATVHIFQAEYAWLTS